MWYTYENRKYISYVFGIDVGRFNTGLFRFERTFTYGPNKWSQSKGIDYDDAYDYDSFYANNPSVETPDEWREKFIPLPEMEKEVERAFKEKAEIVFADKLFVCEGTVFRQKDKPA